MTTYKQQFKQHYKYKSIQTVNKLSQKRYIYRYMSLSLFLKCLCRKSIRFNEPSQWPDKFESRFYCAKYNPPKDQLVPKKVYALCTTEERDCEPSWSIYTKNDEPTIQIKIKRKEWLNQLNKWSGKTCKIYEGYVNYMEESHIAVIHKPTITKKNGSSQTITGHKEIFNKFDLNSYLSLLYFKRKAYSYEKEIRYLIVPTTSTFDNANHVYVDVTFCDLQYIEEVRYSPKLSWYQLCNILNTFIDDGWNPKNYIYRKITLTKGTKEICLYPFNISEGTYINVNEQIII